MNNKSLCPAKGDIIVVILGIARNVLDHTEERREIDRLLTGNALGLKDDQVADRGMVGVKFEIPTTPDETSTRLVDGGILIHSYVVSV